MKQKPDFIGLDLDDTMYNYQPCHEAASSAVTDQASSRLGIGRSKWKQAVSSSRDEVKNSLGDSASSHSRLLYFKLALEKLGLRSHLELALQLETTYWGNFVREIRPAEGLHEFLELTREHGIPVVVMTDLTTSIQIRKLHHLQCLEFIAGLVTSEDVGGDKPNPKFITYSKSNLGIGQGHWWIIGDDLEKDGALAKIIDSSEFINLNSTNLKRITLRDVSKRVEQLCLTSGI